MFLGWPEYEIARKEEESERALECPLTLRTATRPVVTDMKCRALVHIPYANDGSSNYERGLTNVSVRITAIRMSGGTSHEHVTDLWWVNPSTGADGTSSRAAVVTWIEDDNGKAYVEEGGHRIDVGVVSPTSGPKYLRTYADGYWTNNLLSLPRK